MEFNRQKPFLLSEHSEQVMSCLEHEQLTVQHFADAKDFDYLIEQELPCFAITVKRGQLVLLSKHYLAKILLPSGISLEILPKVVSGDVGFDAQSTGHQRTQAIRESREWVATMLADIAADSLQQTLSATSLKSTNANSNPLDGLADVYIASEQTSQKNSAYIQQPSDRPWYEGLLNTAKQKIGTASELLPNRYQTQVNNNPKAQGKLNLKSQLKHNWHRPHYLYSEQAVFRQDAVLMQFLATGWQVLQRLGVNSQSQTIVQTTAVGHNGAYQGVTALAPSQWQSAYQQIKRESATWRIQCSTKQVQTLTQAVAWCWWLLNTMNSENSSSGSMSYHTAVGIMPQPALMVNMNHAFERWVLGKLAVWVSETLPDSRLLMQPSFDWLVGADINDVQEEAPHSHQTQSQTVQSQSIIQRLMPDACIQSTSGEITHVIDVKYKSIDGSKGVSGADWQQLFVYKQHLNCAQAWLIYPMTKKFQQRLDVCIRFDENRQPNQHDNTHLSVIPFSLKQGLVLI